MRRSICALLLLFAIAAMVQAHFVFLVPIEGKRAAMAIFSDDLEPDKNVSIEKIAKTEFYTQDASGKVTKVESTKGKAQLDVAVKGEGPVWLMGVTKYGVLDKGKAPFMLNYYSRTVISDKDVDAKFLALTSDKTPLVLVPVKKSLSEITVKVLGEGKPVADAEVVLVGGKESHKATSAKDGTATVKVDGAGRYALRAKHAVAVKGELGGKKYEEVRSYATLTFTISETKTSAGRSAVVEVADKPKENPEASKLLADARAARANWDAFPGFSATIEVNVDGKTEKGTVAVSGKGKVEVKLDGENKDWARGTLSSIVGHRMDDSTTLNTPCAFLDEVTEHPLGRAIKVLNDEHHSSYRIREQQVIEVNRTMRDMRFTITVLENTKNAEKKYLPSSYVVNTWDLKTNILRSSVSHHNTWQRVGKYDLPATAMAITATAGKLQVRTIKLTDVKLAK